MPKKDVLEMREHVEQPRGVGAFLLVWGVLLAGVGGTALALIEKPDARDLAIWERRWSWASPGSS